MKTPAVILLILIAMIAAACGDSTVKTGNSNGQIKAGVTPVADTEMAVIEMENPGAYGSIKIELYSNIAPQAVARFKELAKEGVYDGVTFHRVNQTVIQAGDPNSKDADPSNDGQGNSTKPNVPAEFSDIPYDTGILGAARKGNDINSANSQFFITLKREASFDKNYTVFGRVVEGMNHARTIAGAKPEGSERPEEPIRIKTIKIVPKS
jgi:peptidylprolyl isomerase